MIRNTSLMLVLGFFLQASYADNCFLPLTPMNGEAPLCNEVLQTNALCTVKCSPFAGRDRNIRAHTETITCQGGDWVLESNKEIRYSVKHTCTGGLLPGAEPSPSSDYEKDTEDLEDEAKDFFASSISDSRNIVVQRNWWDLSHSFQNDEIFSGGAKGMPTCITFGDLWNRLQTCISKDVIPLI
eukprot:498027_1